jgi:hypothetical protein
MVDPELFISIFWQKIGHKDLKYSVQGVVKLTTTLA